MHGWIHCFFHHRYSRSFGLLLWRDRCLFQRHQIIPPQSEKEHSRRRRSRQQRDRYGDGYWIGRVARCRPLLVSYRDRWSHRWNKGETSGNRLHRSQGQREHPSCRRIPPPGSGSVLLQGGGIKDRTGHDARAPLRDLRPATVLCER